MTDNQEYSGSDAATEGVSAKSADDRSSDGRWTIRGVSPEVRQRAVKGAEMADAAVGEWVTQAILAKFEAERAASRLPAVLPPPPPAAADATADLAEHLSVLDSVIRFATAEASDSVRQAADRVIIDRLKLLRITKPGQAKKPKSPPQIGYQSDNPG